MVQRNLSAATRGLNTAIEQLTTGYKLNHSKDNPANYAMMKNMETSIPKFLTVQKMIQILMKMIMIMPMKKKRFTSKQKQKKAILEQKIAIPKISFLKS